MSVRWFLISPLFFVFVGCGSPTHDAGQIPLAEVIARPRHFDGRRIAVTGFVRLQFEGDAVYVTEEDFKRGRIQNRVWLDVPENILARKEDFNWKVALIVGVYNAKHKGHMSAFSGSIEQIERFELIGTGERPPASPN
jgi:hypothetical protein